MREVVDQTIKGKSFWVPIEDTASIRYFTGTDETNIGTMLANVPPDRNAVCVQAGGNLGYFPNAFSEIFERIITFEPDPTNFYCLAHNCTNDNIIKLQAALGYDRLWLEMELPELTHVGLTQVKKGGRELIPTLRIDDLGLTACDFIQLDLEGYEQFAIMGGMETIKKYKPVLALELVGHTTNYGCSDDEIRSMIFAEGYQMVDQIYNDQIFVCT